MARVDSWPETKMLLLRELVATGLSYRKISETLMVSRNAVCGKVMRMGLANTRPKKPEDQEAKPRPRKRPPDRAKPPGHKPVNLSFKPGPSMPPQPIKPIVDADIPPEQLKTIGELEDFHCRWPIGEPHLPTFRYCGALKVVGPHPYCPLHMVRARPSWRD